MPLKSDADRKEEEGGSTSTDSYGLYPIWDMYKYALKRSRNRFHLGRGGGAERGGV